MTTLEQLSGLLMQRNILMARIFEAEEDNVVWEEQLELARIENKLEEIQGGAKYGRRKAVCNTR